TMTLRGTSVAVAVNAQGETHLVVDEGRVTVRSKLTGREVEVGPGDSVDINAEEIDKSERSDTGSSPKQQGNDQRRGEHDSGDNGRSGTRGNGADSGSHGGGSDGGGSDGGGSDGGSDGGGSDSGSSGG